MSLYGTIELLGEDFVFDYVFGYFVRVGTSLWFRGNTPRVRGMVTEVLDIILGGVIMDLGFVNGGKGN